MRETDCENRLNMLETAQKVNSKMESRVHKLVGSRFGSVSTLNADPEPGNLCIKNDYSNL